MARILLIQHRDTSNAGLVGEWIHARGHQATVCRPVLGEALPEFQNFDGAVVFGGPQGANDACPLLAHELLWIERAMEADQRLLGICLGAQLMAKALGARIAPDPHGEVECGYTWVDPGYDNPWIKIPRAVYHWHRDGFDLPEGGTLVARGRGAFPVQGFSRKRSLGFQFHPEATQTIMERWIGRDRDDLARPGACPETTHREEHKQHGRTNALWFERTLDRWLTEP
jgi:GMP synthase (glutamine-hydrolysing)